MRLGGPGGRNGTPPVHGSGLGRPDCDLVVPLVNELFATLASVKYGNDGQLK